MVECICENCGKVFDVKYKSKIRRFCCQKCANVYSAPTRRKEKVRITCAVCGSVFEVQKGDSRLKRKGIKYCSKKCCGLALRKGDVVKCLQCGKEFYTTRRKFCSHKCSCEYKKEHYEHKEYYENGYICMYINGYNKKGNAKKHRYIMEQKLGRRLGENEVVHHKNGVKDDNRIENLELMSREEHSRHHRIEEKKQGKHLFGGYHNN